MHLARATPVFLAACARRVTSLAAIAALSFVARESRGQTQLWKYGTHVADLDRMGDVDGDGVEDVVIVDALGPTPVVLSGRDGSVLVTSTVFAYSGGCSVAGVGDQDGDGVPDLLFGDPMYTDYRSISIGRFVLISGATGVQIIQVLGGDGGTSVTSDLATGVCVRALGDADADGLPDFGVGVLATPGWLLNGPSMVGIWSNGVKSGINATLTGKFNEAFGFPTHTLAPMGDVDGDGGSDFVTGYDDDSTAIGAVDIRSGMTGGLLLTISGHTQSECFGAALGSCGDEDGDGIREVMVGAPFRTVSGIATGSVFIYSGATGTRLRILNGEFDQQQFGADMDGLDDVDGDGVDDFAIQSNGTHGRVQVFSGATGAELERIEGESAMRVRDVGDLDGDGHHDLAVANGVEIHAWKVAPQLAVDSVTPARVRYDQVGTLAMQGAGFKADPNLAVLIDGTPATNVVVTSFTDLTCTAPVLLPGPHDVSVTNKFGTATLAGGLVLTPAMFIDGVATIGATVDLRYEFDALDSSFAIFGLPPQVTIPTPPFGGLLGIAPFTPFLTLASWPTNEYIVHAQIPNDPALSGVTVLFQSLTGPELFGHPKDAAWSNVGVLAIQ